MCYSRSGQAPRWTSTCTRGKSRYLHLLPTTRPASRKERFQTWFGGSKSKRGATVASGQFELFTQLVCAGRCIVAKLSLATRLAPPRARKPCCAYQLTNPAVAV